MTVRTRAELADSIQELINDNNDGDITPGDVRSLLIDIKDSFALSSEVSESNVTETRVNELIQAWISDALTNNTETDIDVALDADNKLNFEVTGSGGTPAVLTHTRYALLTATSATPSAADFLASSITSTTSEITVPAYATAMYLHFADIHSQLTTIQQTNSQFNGRLGFQATPVARTIDGTQHYVYSSVAARNAAGERTWRLEP